MRQLGLKVETGLGGGIHTQFMFFMAYKPAVCYLKLKHFWDFNNDFSDTSPTI